MNGANSLVTVAVPTFNRADYLRATLQSVVEQDYQNIEILVSNNCSTDNSESVVKEFTDPRISYYRQEKNIGMVGNWNYCLNKAKGDFILILSDDDILERQAIRVLVSKLASPSNALAYGRFIYIDEAGRLGRPSYLSPLEETGHSFIVNSLKGVREIVPSVTMHRTADAKQVGGYPPTGTTADLALLLYMAKKGTVVFVPEILLKYRKHGTCLSNDIENVLASHEALSISINNVHNSLHEYSNLFLKYCKRTLFSILLRSDKLDKEPLMRIIKIAKNSSFGENTELLIKIYNLRFFKTIAEIRRKLKLMLQATK